MEVPISRVVLSYKSMEEALGIFFIFSWPHFKHPQVPRIYNAKEKISRAQCLRSLVGPLVRPTFFPPWGLEPASLNLDPQSIIWSFSIFLGTMGHFSRFLTWFSSLFIWNCLKFASANSCYFCISSWVYTTWSDILFLKLATPNFCSILYYFSLESRQVIVAVILTLYGVLYLFKNDKR